MPLLEANVVLCCKSLSQVYGLKSWESTAIVVVLCSKTVHAQHQNQRVSSDATSIGNLKVLHLGLVLLQ
jgi:hypothetical protein